MVPEWMGSRHSLLVIGSKENKCVLFFSSDIPCERYSILLRRDERGYGMTMKSTGPVVVQSVRPGQLSYYSNFESKRQNSENIPDRISLQSVTFLCVIVSSLTL